MQHTLLVAYLTFFPLCSFSFLIEACFPSPRGSTFLGTGMYFKAIPNWSKLVMVAPFLLPGTNLGQGLWHTCGQKDVRGISFCGLLGKIFSFIKQTQSREQLLPVPIVISGHNTWNCCTHLATIMGAIWHKSWYTKESREESKNKLLNGSNDKLGNLTGTSLLLDFGFCEMIPYC